ncbi:MAG: RNA polymerase sigma factor [Chloroflexi bacterium]|nr:RNA polymerase sigma factor [Chloroflexota bacterium]MBV9602255.1 RNA polymerase sigma factor [Chloroflexota bacterium]
MSNCRDSAPSALEALADVYRDEAAQLTATLVRTLGDFELAEELVHDAVVVAMERWPTEGIPRRPGAWLLTVARRRGLDVVRRDARYRAKLALLEGPIRHEPDDRLRLIFTCCHPALAREAQVALTLRTICGFSIQEIARAFLTSEAAIAQRLVRARRKISEARIPYRLPEPDEVDERLDEALAVLYLVFNEGYLTSAGEQPQRRDLSADAEWLASLLSKLLPEEPEVLGLLALIRLHRARSEARFDDRGRLVLLRDQDRSRWDHAAISAAGQLLLRAGRLHRPGPYQVQAAIVACHAEAPDWKSTDWPQILALYDALSTLAPSPVVSLNRAIAMRYVYGPAAALAEVDRLAPELSRYRLAHATRAELLRDLGRPLEARLADEQALALTSNPAERSLLEQRLG